MILDVIRLVLLMRKFLLRTGLFLAGVWTIFSLVWLQSLPGYNPIPSFGWPFLAVQFGKSKTTVYWEYLVLNCVFMLLLSVASILFLAIMAKGNHIQWTVLMMLRFTTYIAVVILLWQSKDFLYDIFLYNIEKYDHVAYYYWEYDPERPPWYLLVTVWMGMIFGLELAWRTISKIFRAPIAA